jgi:hypothetical protein
MYKVHIPGVQPFLANISTHVVLGFILFRSVAAEESRKPAPDPGHK